MANGPPVAPCCFVSNLVQWSKPSAVNSWRKAGLKATFGLTGSERGVRKCAAANLAWADEAQQI